MGFERGYPHARDSPDRPASNRKGRKQRGDFEQAIPEPIRDRRTRRAAKMRCSEVGTLEEFREFVAACNRLEREVALDFAIQCAPDLRWLKQHPQWFRRRPDGSMRLLRTNPPKNI